MRALSLVTDKSNLWEAEQTSQVYVTDGTALVATFLFSLAASKSAFSLISPVSSSCLQAVLHLLQSPDRDSQLSAGISISRISHTSLKCSFGRPNSSGTHLQLPIQDILWNLTVILVTEMAQPLSVYDRMPTIIKSLLFMTDLVPPWNKQDATNTFHVEGVQAFFLHNLGSPGITSVKKSAHYASDTQPCWSGWWVF